LAQFEADLPNKPVQERKSRLYYINMSSLVNFLHALLCLSASGDDVSREHVEHFGPRDVLGALSDGTSFVDQGTSSVAVREHERAARPRPHTLCI
jgi:hypothetical protein